VGDPERGLLDAGRGRRIVNVTMIGHSTLFVEAGGSRIVVDPFFASSIMSISKRVAPLGMTMDRAASDCDLVLVTHNHPDHCDPAFFDMLADDVPVFVPSGFKFMGGYPARQSLVELKPWDTRARGEIVVTCTPAAHPGVCCGYVVESDGRRLYLAGDTNPAPFFADIGKRLQPDAATLPLKNFRLGPGMTKDNIGSAVEALGVSTVIGIHVHLVMSVWPLALPDPKPGIAQAMRLQHPEVEFLTPMPGDSIAV
jgi:L-ascorbate metabolism protein UlaG (beta-lactamase superfamily)